MIVFHPTQRIFPENMEMVGAKEQIAHFALFPSIDGIHQ